MATNLTRFDPVSELSRFDPFNGLENFFRDFKLKPWGDIEAEARIRMDVSETEKTYIVKAEIPGVKKEDIKVNVERNQVSIDAESTKEVEEKEGKRIVRSERYFGHQYRSFTLPHEIDDEKVEAKYHDGVLELTLPKKGNSNGKQITVS